jgi:hypothetical protein
MGGWVTEPDPSNLPNGVSPDCREVAFRPGSVMGRPAFKRIGPTFASQVSYGKTYIVPTGDIQNLYLTVDGKLWVEDFSNNPGVITQIFQTGANLTAKSITAFGREYIAISDGLHGQEIPLQWDGTTLSRVTRDAPGIPPAVSSFAIAPTQTNPTGTPATFTVTEADPAGGPPGGPYTIINFWSPSIPAVLNIGSLIDITGNPSAPMNVTNAPVVAIYGPVGGAYSYLIVLSASTPAGTSYGLGGTATIGSGISMGRANNVVTVNTSTAHGLNVGYRAQISGIPAAQVGGGITSIVINNEDNSGIATVTTASAHGLLPENQVTLTGITGPSIGINTLTLNGEIVTVVTSAASGVAVGSSITIAGVTPSSFNVSTIIAQVINPTTFTYVLISANATGSGGTVTLNWPIPDTATPNYYTVQSVPSANTFQVPIAYSDGTWTGGTVSFAWDGTFFVQSVPSATSFTYKQYGPNFTSSSVGTVTPIGQAAPGQHLVVVLFVSNEGAITATSPPFTFIANGGQYLQVSGIPIGQSEIASRIIAFTLSGGSDFYYIPVPAQVNGSIVSTATQIYNPAITSIVMDFSDPTLANAVGISIPGNNLANQIVLDSCLGFAYYADRLCAYGMRNTVQGLLGMSFDGGWNGTNTNFPLGWTWIGPGGGILQNARSISSFYWQINVSNNGAAYGVLQQPAFADYNGIPIIHANQTYNFRAWFKTSINAPANVVFHAALSSVATGFSTAANISGSGMTMNGGFLEAAFSLPTPAMVPSDLMLTIFATAEPSAASVTLTVDEMSIIYADNPYLDQIWYMSYVGNPEGIDGVTGKIGPQNDTHKIMDFGMVRDNLYVLTQDPTGRLHETADNGVTEPSGWGVNEVASMCGALSAFGLTKSQADDQTASGGPEWFAYASSQNPLIFDGGTPWRIGSEIQPNWSDDQQTIQQGINLNAASTCWALNDPTQSTMYFGLPIGTATSPNWIYALNYKDLQTANEIADASPVRISFSGKRIVGDGARKWAPWNRPMNGAALMRRGAGLQAIFFGGGTTVHLYSLVPGNVADDDFGNINPYYTTYFFVDSEEEGAYQLGSGRKQLVYWSSDTSGTGTMTIIPLVNSLSNPWAIIGTRPMVADSKNDMEWPGGNAQGNRIANKMLSSGGTFDIAKIVAWMRNAPIQVRGAPQS